MSNLQQFSFNSQSVRVISINGDPWFVANDVLNAIKSTTKINAMKATILEGLGEGYVNNTPLETSGGIQETTIIHEAAVTFLVSRSRTETGKAFNRLLHTEILPTIRKTGKYEVEPAQVESASPKPSLPTRDAVEYIQAAETLSKLPDNRLSRLLGQMLVSEVALIGVNQKQLSPANEEVKQYTTAKVRASQLGYSLKRIGSGASLGKFVKAGIAPEFTDWQGQYIVNHFEVNANLDARIHSFFLGK